MSHRQDRTFTFSLSGKSSPPVGLGPDPSSPSRLREESFPRSSSQNRRRFRAKTPKGFLYLLFSALFSISNCQNCWVIFVHFLLGIGGALETKRETSGPDHRPTPTEHPTQQCKQTLTLESFNLSPPVSFLCSRGIPKGPFFPLAAPGEEALVEVDLLSVCWRRRKRPPHSPLL